MILDYNFFIVEILYTKIFRGSSWRRNNTREMVNIYEPFDTIKGKKYGFSS
jgi:hypothetical protein